MGSHRAPSKPEPNSRAAEHTGEKATGPPAGRRQCHASHTQTGARSTGSRVTAANLHASTSAYCIGQQEEPGFRWHEHDKTQRGRLASGGGPGGGGSSTSWISRWLACPCGAAERKQRTSACANNKMRDTQAHSRRPASPAGGRAAASLHFGRASGARPRGAAGGYCGTRLRLRRGPPPSRDAR